MPAEGTKELGKGIAKIMETLIGRTEYTVKTTKYPDAKYVDTEYAQIMGSQKVLKRIYKSFAFAINALLTFTESSKL